MSVTVVSAGVFVAGHAAAGPVAIDAVEAEAIRGAQAPGLSFGRLVARLGQMLVFDRSLSVTGTQACATCHAPDAGFAGAGGVLPGAVAPRAGFRVPQSLAYAAEAPVLRYRAITRDFAGGNLWDSRATGLLSGSAAVDQAAVPLTSPFEMALPDSACAVRRVALAPYGALFAKVWGSPAIAWPADTDAVCARPIGGMHAPTLHLSMTDRARADLVVRQIGQTVATFQMSPLASPFASRFDAVRAGRARFTAQEQRGAALFAGRGRCAACHVAAGSFPVFTDFTSHNIGVPRNAAFAFLAENRPDRFGYVANPAGAAFVDEGLGGFLATSADSMWRAQAGRFEGAFQVPTLRNVALRRSYMHNGVFTDLPTVVHFLNTRDVLPRWPAPEEPRNVERRLTGNLGLSAEEEAALVAFLVTLSDVKQ